ncbi:hypothetical protein PSHT_10322 [Puccinia striiformis]|uniref:Uncharacterized protein n=1 Tax=Puccinia striiformis TaxID=27350 RepID=A0A2S4VAD1_9BASI|nr:hypothetical protein PSHT_10322 [Puccinia striiformis]
MDIKTIIEWMDDDDDVISLLQLNIALELKNQQEKKKHGGSSVGRQEIERCRLLGYQQLFSDYFAETTQSYGAKSETLTDANKEQVDEPAPTGGNNLSLGDPTVDRGTTEGVPGAATAAVDGTEGQVRDSQDDERVEIERSLLPEITILADNLSRVPNTSNEEDAVVKNPDSLGPTATQSCADRVLKSATEGDRASADFFLRIYASLSKVKPEPTLPVLPVIKRSHSASAVLQAETATGSSNIVYIDGTLPGHNKTGFTPYFNKAIKALFGIIPLTIFDKNWQAAAIEAHIRKKNRSDEKNGEYAGFEYPNEWTQTFATWTLNYRNFLVTLRDVYDHKDFAVWILKHKENMDDIITKHGFLTGFRYDIHVRQNTFALRKTRMSDGKELMTDISVFRKPIFDEAWTLTQKLDELDFTDNPYVLGGPKSEWDPMTGKPKMPKNQRWNSEGDTNQSGFGGRGGKSRRGDNQGYHGNGWGRNQGGAEWGGEGLSQKRKGSWGNGGDNGNKNDGGRGLTDGGSGNRRRDGCNGNGFAQTVGLETHAENVPKEVLWPEEITCEMDVEAWEIALRECNLLPAFQDVLEGFVEGFDQGIPKHKVAGLQSFTPDNHKSSELARQKIEESIQKELLARRMNGLSSHDHMKTKFPFLRSSPLGAVVNGDGLVRTINDLSYPRNDLLLKSVNSFVNSDDFETTWDDFKTLSKLFAEDERPFELALFDWEKAYRQIPTRKEQWKYPSVKDFEGNLLLDTQITFGGVAGCGSFGRPADVWKLIM